MAVAWVAGPLPGGAILEFGSWHGIFWLMALASAVMFAMIFSPPETLPPQKRSTKPIVSSFRNYLRLLQDAKFMRYTLSVTFACVAAYAFITGFVYIHYFGIPSKYYGFLFGINIVGVMALSFVNKKLVKRYALNRLLIVSTLVAALAASVLFAFAFFKTGGVLGVIIPMFFVFSMNGIIASCSNAAALDSVPQEMKGFGRCAHRLAATGQQHPFAFYRFLCDACSVFCEYAVDDVLDNSSVCLAKRARGVF